MFIGWSKISCQKNSHTIEEDSEFCVYRIVRLCVCIQLPNVRPSFRRSQILKSNATFVSRVDLFPWGIMAVFWLGDQPTACKCLPIIVVHSAVDPQPVELFYSGTEASICWFYQTSPTQRIRCYLRAVRRHALYYLVRHDNSTLARSVPSATQHPWLRASRSWMGNSVLIVHLKGDCCSNRGMHSSRSVARAYPRAWCEGQYHSVLKAFKKFFCEVLSRLISRSMLKVRGAWFRLERKTASFDDAY